jgi:hypothetical protein
VRWQRVEVFDQHLQVDEPGDAPARRVPARAIVKCQHTACDAWRVVDDVGKHREVGIRADRLEEIGVRNRAKKMARRERSQRPVRVVRSVRHVVRLRQRSAFAGHR